MSRKRTEEKEIKSIFESSKLGFKDGTEVEKGIVLNPEYLDEHFEDIGNMIQTFSAYPDIFLDMITPEDDEFCLFFYQRIVLRAAMRYIGFYLTAPRALNFDSAL